MPKEILKGIIPVSGPYDVRARGRPGEVYTYAPTPELREQASPILHVTDPVPAALVAVGSEEGIPGVVHGICRGIKSSRR